MTKIALTKGRVIDGTGRLPISPGTVIKDGSVQATGSFDPNAAGEPG